MDDFLRDIDIIFRKEKPDRAGDNFIPSFIETRKKGMLKTKIREAYRLMESCVLCGRYCRVNRMKGEKGFCNTGKLPVVSSFGPHYGEESPLVGRYGSGTVFLTGCNLGCMFCQNYDISIGREGSTHSVSELSDIIMNVRHKGCHNINFVTPSHQMPMILEALDIAAEKGLNVPVIWNCGGYESPEALEILDGVVDIYMPDFKFFDSKPAKKYLNAEDYPETAKNALKEMHRQVGDLQMDDRGIAVRGLLVRHLVMPGRLAGTAEFVKWLAEEVSPDTYVNIMRQYHPCHKAKNYKEINRRITDSEFREAVEWAGDQGLRLDKE